MKIKGIEVEVTSPDPKVAELAKEKIMKIMNDIELTTNGTALYGGKEYPVHSFDYAGREAITIPDLDLISYDDGDNWQDMD